jgi:hypothetical protein
VPKFDELSRREKDDRWRNSHQQQIAKRKAMLSANGQMTPAEAERKATRMQEGVTNRARAQTEGRR